MSHRSGSGPVVLEASFVGKTAAFRSTFFCDFSLFSRICCHSAAVRRLCSAVFLSLLLAFLKSTSLCGRLVAFFLRLCYLFCFWCPPGCLWLPRWLPEGAPPTFGSQKLLMVLFSYCKRNKPGRPPKWSQKGILVLLAAPGSLRCSGLVWAAVGCIGALTPPGKYQLLFVHGSGT